VGDKREGKKKGRKYSGGKVRTNKKDTKTTSRRKEKLEGIEIRRTELYKTRLTGSGGANVRVLYNPKQPDKMKRRKYWKTLGKTHIEETGVVKTETRDTGREGDKGVRRAFTPDPKSPHGTKKGRGPNRHRENKETKKKEREEMEIRKKGPHTPGSFRGGYMCMIEKKRKP